MTSAPTSPITVLVVDDDAVAVNIIARAFQNARPHTRVQIAADGIAAYQYMSGVGQFAERSLHPLPDLILLDINMPRFSGIDFLRWLREKAPEAIRDTAVVIISSSSGTAEIECARALGAKLFFPKPLRWPDLWKSIESEGLLEPRPEEDTTRPL